MTLLVTNGRAHGLDDVMLELPSDWLHMLSVMLEQIWSYVDSKMGWRYGRVRRVRDPQYLPAGRDNDAADLMLVVPAHDLDL